MLIEDNKPSCAMLREQAPIAQSMRTPHGNAPLVTGLDSPFDSDSDSVFSSDSYHPREERLKEKLAQAQAEADLQGMIKQEHPYYIDMDEPDNQPPIHRQQLPPLDDSDSDSIFSSDSYHPREERRKEKLAQAEAEAA